MIKGAWIRKKTQIIWVLKNLHARKCDQLQFGNITLSFNKEGYRKVKVVVYPSNKYLLKFNNRNTGTTSTGNCFLGNNYFCTKAPFVSVIKTYLMMQSVKDVLENVSLKLLWYFQEIELSLVKPILTAILRNWPDTQLQVNFNINVSIKFFQNIKKIHLQGSQSMSSFTNQQPYVRCT